MAIIGLNLIVWVVNFFNGRDGAIGHNVIRKLGWTGLKHVSDQTQLLDCKFFQPKQLLLNNLPSSIQP